MILNRLCNGIYQCPVCLQEYEAIRVRENKLLCARCGKRLIHSMRYENWCMAWMERLFKMKRRKGGDPPAWLVNLVLKYIEGDHLTRTYTANKNNLQAFRKRKESKVNTSLLVQE